MDVKLKSKKLQAWFQDDRLTIENQACYLSRLYSMHETLYESSRKLLSDTNSTSTMNTRPLIAQHTFFTDHANSGINLSRRNSNLSNTSNNTTSNPTMTKSFTHLPQIAVMNIVTPKNKKQKATNKNLNLNVNGSSLEKELDKENYYPNNKKEQKQFTDVIDGKQVFEEQSQIGFTVLPMVTNGKTELPNNVKLKPGNLESITRIKKLLHLDDSLNADLNGLKSPRSFKLPTKLSSRTIGRGDKLTDNKPKLTSQSFIINNSSKEIATLTEAKDVIRKNGLLRFPRIQKDQKEQKEKGIEFRCAINAKKITTNNSYSSSELNDFYTNSQAPPGTPKDDCRDPACFFCQYENQQPLISITTKEVETVEPPKRVRPTITINLNQAFMCMSPAPTPEVLI